MGTPAPGRDDRGVLVVIGPSGSGKSTLVRHLHERGLIEVVPTWTTRPRRADEAHGSLEHRFVDDDGFDTLARCGCFLAVARPFGPPHRYGMPRRACAARPPGRPVPAVIARAPLVPVLAAHVPRPVVYQVEAHRPWARPGRAGEDRRAQDALGRRMAHRVFLNEGPVGELVDAVAAAIAHDFEEAACPRTY